MAEGNNQKLKILYLCRILLERTDEEHKITMEEILAALKAYGITAERKALYSDIENLRLFGLDIIGVKEGRTYYYYVGSRMFEIAELKLLVDSVQSARFITARKSDELIRKIEALASRPQASQLQRQVYTSERIKADNKNIYYNVDAIHTAIAENRRVRFRYFNWNAKKEQVLRRDGAYYEISPWALSWDDENYYMIGYDSEAGMIKHYRVDKMLDIKESKEKREGGDLFRDFDVGAYAKRMFGMFGAKEENVQILAENSMAGIFIDRFGRDVPMYPVDDGHFRVTVKAAVSPHFLSWVMALGSAVKITGPDSVLSKVNEEIDRLVKQYGRAGGSETE